MSDDDGQGATMDEGRPCHCGAPSTVVLGRVPLCDSCHEKTVTTIEDLRARVEQADEEQRSELPPDEKLANIVDALRHCDRCGHGEAQFCQGCMDDATRKVSAEQSVQSQETIASLREEASRETAATAEVQRWTHANGQHERNIYGGWVRYDDHRRALAAGEEETELHAKINAAVSDALGQNITESWHDLGEKVLALRQDRDRLREALVRLRAAGTHHEVSAARVQADAALGKGE